MIIGQPRTLDDVPPLTAEEIAGMYQMTAQILGSGQPLDMPSLALTGKDFARLVKTVQVFQQAAAAVQVATSPEAVVPPSEEEIPSRLGDLLSRFGSTT